MNTSLDTRTAILAKLYVGRDSRFDDFYEYQDFAIASSWGIVNGLILPTTLGESYINAAFDELIIFLCLAEDAGIDESPVDAGYASLQDMIDRSPVDSAYWKLPSEF